MNVLVLYLISLVVVLSQTIYPWTCSSYDISLVVNQPMTPVVCTCKTTKNGRITPTLPDGLVYTRVYGTDYLQTITISGTPIVGLQKKTFTVGYEDYISTFTIEIFSQPTSISYGFKDMNLFTNVLIEPIPIHSNTAITTFTVNPAFPEGLLLNSSSGIISGFVVDTTSTGTVYTVTATNDFGSTSTTITFTIKDASEMTTSGFTACYWASTTECLTPSFNYFYKTPAQYCQQESKIDFSTSNNSVWPGLDYRFRDFFSAYMYGYFNIQTPGTYNFYFISEDGALFYIDDLDSIFINREGCRGFSTTQGTKTLSAGLHIFAIRFFELNEEATLKVEYENTKAGINRIVADYNVLKVGGRGPTFIEYPIISGILNADITTYQPTMSSGGATSWSVNPPLPDGIHLDSTSGYISGRPLSISNSVHTVTASSYMGSSEAIVHVIVDAPLVAGLYTKYYTIANHIFCRYQALPDNQMDLTVIKIDDNINHPAQNPFIPWTGLTADFTANFYVVWEGYLHHDAIGEWGLKITCDDGCRLLSTNNNELIDHWGCHSYTSKETTRAISSVGYYYYKIEYQQSGGNGGMKLEWRCPGGDYTDIPSDKMFYTPPTVVSYQYEMAHYFVNIAIPENKPIFFGASDFSDFHIYPPLPVGLTINPSTGVISGIPTSEIHFSHYTITCSNGVSTETAVISMDVVLTNTLSGLSLVMNDQPVSEVTLNAFVEMTPITVTKSDSIIGVTSFSISPDLPDGLVIDVYSGTISGTPQVSLEQTTYTITAKNSFNSTIMQFSLIVVGCQGVDNGQSWTNSYYTLTLLSGYGSIKLLDSNDAIIQCGSNGQVDINGNAIMSECEHSLYSGSIITYCFKPEEAQKIYINCQSNYGCSYQVKREDGHYDPVQYIYSEESSAPYIETRTWYNDLIPLTEITFSPSNEFSYVGYSSRDPISIFVDGSYSSISINPPLGEEIDLSNPTITMSTYSNHHSRYVYTITATNAISSVTATLTINLLECTGENGARLITFEKWTFMYGNEESYEVYNSDNKLLLSVGDLVAYSRYIHTLCLTAGTYHVIMRDSYGDGWGYSNNNRSYIHIKDPSGALFKEMTIPYQPNRKVYSATDYFTFTINETPKTTWKVSIDGTVDTNWYSVDYDSSNWVTKNNGVVGSWNDNTVYFINEFTIDDVSLYSLLEFSVYFRDGIVVYLNGVQVYLRNLPQNFNHNTQASTHYDGYYQRIITAPGHHLSNGKNTIAIEIHRHSSTSGDIFWNAYVTPLQGTCISRTLSGTVTESLAFNSPTEGAGAVWDDLPTTNWVGNSLPAWTTWSYNFDRVEWINKIVLGSASTNPESDPTEINVYGSNDGMSWDLIKKIKKIGIWSSRSETKEFMMMDHLNAYGQYKIEITDSYNHVRRTGLSTIDLQACQITYCIDEEHVWPGTPAGQSVSIECGEGFIGERTRTCGNEELNPQWLEIDESECRSLNPPKNTVYIDFAIAVTEITPEQMMAGGAEAVVSAFISIYPILPSEIEAWKVKDITDDSIEHPIQTTVVWIRITRSLEGADEVLTYITNSLSDISSAAKSNNGDIFPEPSTFSFYMLPLLSKRKRAECSRDGLKSFVSTLPFIPKETIEDYVE